MLQNKIPVWVILFWITLWQVSSMIVGFQILLPSPLSVIISLCEIVVEYDFWISIFYSLLKISIGFIFAVLIGVVFAFLSHKFLWFKQLVSPVVLFSKSVPVACFIILILIWVKSKNLSIYISFMMVMPVIYTNILIGIDNLSNELNEMASVFKFTSLTKFRYIIFPQIFPYFSSAITLGLGLAFKAGIAAEVIGIPKNSIGENLYYAKLYLDTPALFAWTMVIIIVSFLFEKLFVLLAKILKKRIEKVKL